MAARDDLQRKFENSNRFPCFGDAIERMTVEGIRCHHLTTIEITSPITAFCGLNGTGKSTLLQMAAVAYSNSSQRAYTVRDFLVLSRLDPCPFTDFASIKYHFCDSGKFPRHLTISRSSGGNRWNGYGRRKERKVFFAGVGLYLPRIETRDFVVRNANSFSVVSSDDVNTTVKDWTCKILGHSYDAVKSNVVEHSNHRKHICSVTRKGCSYSETHMGFGEGRAQFMIHALETLPDKSLVLIEEPETSLHQRAQHAFGQYIIDVCIRKGHQVFLTTHSQYLLNALHSQSRIFLYHADRGIKTLRGLAATQANSLLTEGFEKALTVLVEDDCARILLAELVRRIDKHFLGTIAIVVGGGANDLGAAARAMKAAPLRIAVVRDGDMGDAPTDFIFKLPGIKPPEKELLEDAHVQSTIDRRYGGSVANILAANTGADHHQWFEKVAQSVNASREAVIEEAARSYATDGTLANEVNTLINQLKDAASQ